jgi:tight adherence protein C
MALLVCALLLLAATGVVIGGVLNERQRTRQVSQRLLGQVGRDNKLGSWMRVLGDSSFGRRSVSLDTETQILLNRIGWRKASQRSFYAACQIGMPVLALVLVLVVQNLFFPTFEQGWISLLCALGLGYLLPKRVLASAARRRQEQIAQEVSTFIPLLRILFESGMAVEQALRVLSNEARLLLPQLSAELRLLLARVDSGLELSEELAKTANQRYLCDSSAIDPAGRRGDEIAAITQATARRSAADSVAGIYLQAVGEDVGGDDAVFISGTADRVGRTGVYGDSQGF